MTGSGTESLGAKGPSEASVTPKVTSRAFFDVGIGGKETGRTLRTMLLSDKPLHGKRVAIRPSVQDNLWAVWLLSGRECDEPAASISLALRLNWSAHLDLSFCRSRRARAKDCGKL